jgi:homoserine O-acetyltransferase
VSYPELVERVIVVAATAALTAQAIAFSEGYASLDAALRRIRSKALFIGIRSDFLFPAVRVRWLADQVSAVGGDATYVEIDSPHGHDAFLKEWRQMNDALNVMKE